MKKPQAIALTVSIFCALAVMAVGVIMIFSQPEKDSLKATTGTSVPETSQTAENTETEKNENNQPENKNEENNQQEESQEQITQPPTDLPPFVEILPEKDPVTGEPETGITFPCTIDGYDLVLEKIAPYDGPYVEDGTNAQAQQVAMIMVKNNGEYPIEYAQLAVEYGDTQLTFAISALPKGERLVVQAQNAQTIPQGSVTKVNALVVQRAEFELSSQQIQVTDQGDGRLKVENLTDQTFSSVRLFYKHYMKDEKLFVGGIAFTVQIYRLGAKDSAIIQPAHYGTTGRVVMVRTYE